MKRNFKLVKNNHTFLTLDPSVKNHKLTKGNHTSTLKCIRHQIQVIRGQQGQNLPLSTQTSESILAHLSMVIRLPKKMSQSKFITDNLLTMSLK